MKDFLMTGGITGMSIILVLAVLSLASAFVFFGRRGMKLDIVALDRTLWVSTIALGGIALLFGVFYQTLGLYQAFEVIKEASDISPSIIMGGLFVSFYSTMFGLGVSVVSLLLWFIIRVAWMNDY